MASEYIPYILIALICLFIGSCVYLWKHRAEVFEMTGIDPSTVPGGDKLKINKKKPKPIHPNAKKSIKYKPPSVIEQKMPKQQKPNDGEIVKRAPRSQDKKQPKIITKNKSISDFPLKTEDSPIKTMHLSQEGFLVAVGRDRMCHVYVPMFLEMADTFFQRFELDPCEVSNARIFRQPDLRIAYIEHPHRKLCVSKIVIRNEEGKFEAEEKQEIADPFKSTVQSFIVHPQGEYIAILSDQNTLRLYSTSGEVIFEQVFQGKRCLTMTATNDFTRLFVGVGMNIIVFDWNSKKKLLTQKCEVPVKSSIFSLAYVPKTKELVCVSDNALVLFPKKIESGKEKEKWELPGCRLVAASQISPLVVVICGKSRMRIVDISNGKLSGELSEAHEGEINHCVWSQDDKWIFVASKQRPNIESFRYAVDK